MKKTEAVPLQKRTEPADTGCTDTGQADKARDRVRAVLRAAAKEHKERHPAIVGGEGRKG